MNIRSTWLAAAMAGVCASAGAQQSAAPPQSQKLPPICVPGGDCSKYQHLLTYPAHALSYANTAFALHQRGVNWPDDNGAMSLTLRRPPDYKGGKVRLTLFHQVLSDSDGTIAFHVTPVTFNHGNSFETYGAVSTNILPAPLTLTILLQQSAVIEPGNGWSPDGNWWYFEIGRGGTFTGGLRVMSVAVEY